MKRVSEPSPAELAEILQGERRYDPAELVAILKGIRTHVWSTYPTLPLYEAAALDQVIAEIRLPASCPLQDEDGGAVCLCGSPTPSCRYGPPGVDAEDVRDRPLEEIAGLAGWVDWRGGECPLPEDAIFYLEYRRAGVRGPNTDPQGYPWKHTGGHYDIVRYLPVRPAGGAR